MTNSTDKVRKILFYSISMIVIIMLWFIMHVFKVKELPAGLHLDEAGMAYDAFCIANWGIDRYQNPFPVYFYNYGGGMSAAYVYLCAILIKFLGTGTLVLRFPAIIFSLITLISIFFIVKKAFCTNWAILAAFLYCILPYFTMQARFGLDCNLMLGAVCLATWILLEALERDKWYWYTLCGILWGLSLYTYIISYMVLPVFFALVCGYLLYIRKINLRKLLYAAVPFLILAVPLIVMAIITFLQLDPIMTPYFTIPCINGQRMNEFSLNILGNLGTFLRSVFLTDDMEYNAISGFYTLYILSLPFCAMGIISCINETIKNIRQRSLSISLIIVAYCLSQLLIGTFKTNTNINNMNGIYFTLLFFIVAGIRATHIWFDRFTRARRLLIPIIIVAYLASFITFAGYYFCTYSKNVPYLFTERLSPVFESHDAVFTGNNIYLDAYYTYYLLERKIDPRTLNLTVGEEVVGLYNINFHTIDTPLPSDLTKYGIYIIQANNYAYRDILSGAGLHYETAGPYLVFYQ